MVCGESGQPSECPACEELFGLQPQCLDQVSRIDHGIEGQVVLLHTLVETKLLLYFYWPSVVGKTTLDVE